MFCKPGGQQIECKGQTLEDSKRSLPLVIPIMTESMCVCVCVCVCMCVCARGSYFEDDGKCCHTSYHQSGIPSFSKLLTTHRILVYRQERIFSTLTCHPDKIAEVV
jgi:hypothetical protein